MHVLYTSIFEWLDEAKPYLNDIGGRVGYKSKQLKARQYGNAPEVIAYADKANERLRRKFYKLVLKNNKKHNVAVAAVARELACFVWGMMTDRIA